MNAKFYWKYLPWGYIKHTKREFKFPWPVRPTSCISFKNENCIFHTFSTSLSTLLIRWILCLDVQKQDVWNKRDNTYCSVKAAYSWKKEPRVCETYRCVQWSMVDEMSRLGTEVLIYKSGRDRSAIDNWNHQTSEPNKQ